MVQTLIFKWVMSQSIKSMGGEGLDYKILDNVTVDWFWWWWWWVVGPRSKAP